MAPTIAALQCVYQRVRSGRETVGVIIVVTGGLIGVLPLVLLAFGHWLRGGSYLAGVLLLLLLGWRLYRSSHSCVNVALTEAALELRIVGGPASETPTERWPLSSISSYSLLALNEPHGVQIKLFRTDGKTLVLRDSRKQTAPDLTGYLPLHDFCQELVERLRATNQNVAARLNFYQSFWGHLIAATMVLVAVGGGVAVYVERMSLSGYLTMLTGATGFIAYYVRNNQWLGGAMAPDETGNSRV
ncbi:hypothetical protein LJ737_22730 [Hymenobacter sp. 15J16-1T3B]|uniref:hypothetical protein n=1 Tax=Hymenobacter sp. 15J16-1T3B TaxID=2886941 RepID=UPI001D0FD446|nr:hypothetical protein [Hymenobacter sp. 15J16-1T3B]MCC3160070.1 hypothetical protein [Hymenobacter sp. 15J16-1T3B]